MSTISTLRQEIDQVHKEMYALLVRRRDLTMAIWKIKQEQGMPFFNAEREEQILKDFVALNAGKKKDPRENEQLDSCKLTRTCSCRSEAERERSRRRRVPSIRSVS